MALGPLARRQSGGSLSSFKEKQGRGQVCPLLPMRGGGGGQPSIQWAFNV